MRPLELTLEGFKSYRERCSFNFEGRSLFGIVGPTGSGKSSILDGLIYCLYGKTPRLERETKKLINSQGDEAKLQLIFEMEGVAWQVTRVLRRKGQSQVLLDRMDGAGDRVSGERNVNEKLGEVLGLDFNAFCSSVCLSQGEFDRFLSASPSERVQILKGVFSLDRVDVMREMAKGHSRLLGDELRILQATLDALPPRIEEAIDAAEEELKAAETRVDQINTALPAVREAELQIEQSAQQEDLIRREKGEIALARTSIPQDEVIMDLVARESIAIGAAREAEAAAGAAEATLNAAAEQMAAIEQRGRGWDWCSEVDSVMRSLAAVEEDHRAETEAAARLAEGQSKSQADVAQLQEEYDRAQEAVRLARMALAETEQRHAAHFLRRNLTEGAPCPVCEQPVARVPGVEKLPAVDRAKGLCDEAERAQDDGRNALELAKRNHALLEDRLRSAEQRTATLGERIGEIRTALVQLVGPGLDPKQELTAGKNALATLNSVVQQAESARRQATLELKQASSVLQKVRSEVVETISVLSSVCGRLGIPRAIIDEEGLPQAAKRAVEEAVARLEDLDRRAALLASGVESARSIVRDFCVRFGGAETESPAAILADALSSAQSLTKSLDDLRAALARRKEAESEMAVTSGRKDLFDRLSTDLTDSKFTAYLLTEQTRLLCELASEKFRQLTGYYTFDFDAHGNITVVDDRTGAVRSPQDTLSGGESFLASLSLALALAETVAGRGGRLECFFLDEGFGSLDAEALDRAMEGIQSLAEPGRMIALISHVAGVQTSLEDLIVLERNDDGSTSVVQEAGPIAYLPAAI